MSRETYIFRDDKFILKAKDGELTPEYLAYQPLKSHIGIVKDDLPGGINGMLSHADGKRYDSKSNYEKAVRAKGCRIVGNDLNKSDLTRREIYGDFNVRPQLKEAVQRHLHG